MEFVLTGRPVGRVGELFCSSERPLQLGNEPFDADSKRLAKGPQLDHINPPLAPLAFTDERLRLAEFLSELHLRQAGTLPGLP